MSKYTEALESMVIVDDPDVIAIEAFISSALESDVADAKKLKSNLNKLARAKSSGDNTAINEAKEEVKESIDDVNEAAENEKDANRKAKLKKIAKIGAAIAGTIVAAAGVAVAAKKLKNNVDERRARGAEIAARIDKNNEILKQQQEEINRALADLDGRGENLAKSFKEKGDALKKRADEIFDTPESKKKIADLQDRMRKYNETLKDKK